MQVLPPARAKHAGQRCPYCQAFGDDGKDGGTGRGCAQRDVVLVGPEGHGAEHDPQSLDTASTSLGASSPAARLRGWIIRVVLHGGQVRPGDPITVGWPADRTSLSRRCSHCLAQVRLSPAGTMRDRPPGMALSDG